MGFYDSLSESFQQVSADELALNSFFAAGIIIIGVLLGKLIDIGLRKLLEKFEINKHIRGSFIELFLLVIRWTIYIIFINFGIDQLGIPIISEFFSSILMTIPAFTGALLLLIIGFGLAYYLNKIIKSSEAKGSDFISEFIFFFVIFIFGIYSIKIALIPLDPAISSSLITILVAICSAG